MRRQQQIPVSDENRNNPDRRVLLKDSEGTLQRLRNISLFKSLTDLQLKEIAGICAKKIYNSQNKIYTIGDESTDMFILMKGKISITFNTGVDRL